MRRSAIIWISLSAGAFLLPSCGGDDDPSGDGGTGGSAGKAGSSAKGGSAGKSGASGKGGGDGKSGSSGRSGSAGKSGASGKGGGAGRANGGGAGTGATGGSSGESGGGQAGGEHAGASGAGGAGAPDACWIGEAGSGGTGSGAAGAAGDSSNPGPQSFACSTFPGTVTLGPTVSIGTYGAVLCEAFGTACRLTTNTCSDGPDPCAEADKLLTFLAAVGGNSLRVPDDVKITDTTAGTISHSKRSLSAIPTSTSVTTSIERVGGDTWEFVFEFGTGRSFTFTSWRITGHW